MIKDKKVLILAPHTDDGEIGCGGTISKIIEDKKDVYYIAFSICEKSVPDKYPSNILEKEVRDATKILGIPENNLFILNYPVREFNKYRQEILDNLINYKKKVEPDLIFLPSKQDLHQDHSVIFEEGIRAFKDRNILGYEIPWNNMKFENRLFSILDKRHIDRKIKSLSKYKSQNFRDYFSKEYIESLAVTRGIQIKQKYAECFEVLRIFLN